MIKQDKNVFIIILNWNGWSDTLGCVSSILRSNYKNYRIIIVDNGSTDDSINNIKAWGNSYCLKENSINTGASSYSHGNLSVFEYDNSIAQKGGNPLTEQILSGLMPQEYIVIIKNGKNYGFASGNNFGIKYALNAGADYILLLNNDTIISNDSLSVMLEFLNNNDMYSCVTAQIRYYSPNEVIWNCGGMLTWYGGHKYRYSGKTCDKIPNRKFDRITFITGCTLLCRKNVFEKIGLLSEKYFFGEEDQEFSMRMHKFKVKAACCYEAIIYHKVGSSIDKSKKNKMVSKAYIHYLNRLINLKYYWPEYKWILLRFLYLLHIHSTFHLKYKISFATSIKITKSIFRDSSNFQSVNKQMFNKIMNTDWI